MPGMNGLSSPSHPHHTLNLPRRKHMPANHQPQRLGGVRRSLLHHPQQTFALAGFTAQLHTHRLSQRHAPALFKGPLRQLPSSFQRAKPSSPPCTGSSALRLRASSAAFSAAIAAFHVE